MGTRWSRLLLHPIRRHPTFDTLKLALGPHLLFTHPSITN